MARTLLDPSVRTVTVLHCTPVGAYVCVCKSDQVCVFHTLLLLSALLLKTLQTSFLPPHRHLTTTKHKVCPAQKILYSFRTGAANRRKKKEEELSLWVVRITDLLG